MTMEAKVYYGKKIRVKKDQIDHIPKCFQLPRTVGSSKPRTEFKFGICGFKDMSNDSISDTVDLSPTRSTEPQNRRRKTVKKGIKLPLTDVKSFGGKAHLQPCNKRKDEDGDDALELSPNKLVLTENCEGAYGVNHPGQSPDKDNSTSSSRTRSMRERKRKVHFDEITPLYTSRRVRRFKVMRSLGLAAPVGSPFNSSMNF